MKQKSLWMAAVCLIALIVLMITAGCVQTTTPTPTPTPPPTTALFTPTPTANQTPTLAAVVVVNETPSYKFEDFQKWILDNRRGALRDKANVTHRIFTIDFESNASQSGYKVYDLLLRGETYEFEGVIVKLNESWYFVDPDFNDIVPLENVYGYYLNNFAEAYRFEKGKVFYYQFNNTCVIKGLTDSDGWINLKEIYDKAWKRT